MKGEIEMKKKVHTLWKDRKVNRKLEEERLGDIVFKNVDVFKKGLNGRRKKRYMEELGTLIDNMDKDKMYYEGKRGKKIHYSLFNIDGMKMVVFNK